VSSSVAADTADLTKIGAFAYELRKSIVTMLAAAGSGHSAGPLGMADFMAVLYADVLRHDPQNPDWPERDVFFLSHGHTAPVLYAALAESGYFPKEELLTLRAYGSRLQGHPERKALPGLESTSGPLGSGLSQAAGYAYALRHLRPDPARRVYVAMGDGELDEGNIWEAAMFASAYSLGNLIGIVDRNRIQIDGDTEDVMPLGDLASKFRSFGWTALDVDGHDLEALVGAFAYARASADRPTVLIAHTIPGKGVSFMESDHRWHGKPPTTAQRDSALAEFEAAVRL
jgi:transketolase